MAHILTSFSPTKAIAIDEAGSGVTYIGMAKVGTTTEAARWQIRKISKSGNITLFQFADSDDRYDNVWDDRVSLVYG